MINQSLRVAALATAATLLVPLLGGTLAAVPAQAQGGDGGGLGPDVFPPLKRSLVAYYDFDHPVPGAPARNATAASPGRTSTW